jgi:hypothetical protein
VALLQRLQELQDLRANRNVERRTGSSRMMQRDPDTSARDRDALPLTAAELVRIA